MKETAAPKHYISIGKCDNLDVCVTNHEGMWLVYIFLSAKECSLFDESHKIQDFRTKIRNFAQNFRISHKKYTIRTKNGNFAQNSCKIAQNLVL